MAPKIAVPAEELLPLGGEDVLVESLNGSTPKTSMGTSTGTNTGTSEYQTLVKRLEEPLAPGLTRFREGAFKRELEYLPAHTVKRQLNRLFGYGKWSTYGLAIKTVDGADGFPVFVYATITLSVSLPDDNDTQFTNVGTGVVRQPKKTPVTEAEIAYWHKTRPAALDMAVKGAVSDAIKRCATALGTQFGLALYETDGDDDDGEPQPLPTAAEGNAPRPIRATSERDSYECVNCGKPVRTYTDRQGKTVTAEAQAKMRRGDYCYDCYSNR